MEREELILEPTLDVEASPMMEPAQAVPASASATPAGRYWEAQGFADTLRAEFDAAGKAGKVTLMREQFYLLVNYHNRTLAILRSSFQRRREELARATLHNLIALHSILSYMHRAAPAIVPSPLSLDRKVRSRFLEDLVVRVLEEAAGPLDLGTLTARVNALDVLADVSERVMLRHLDNLLDSGHLLHSAAAYARSARTYSPVNLGRAGLMALLGQALYERCDAAGFHGLGDAQAHPAEFRTLLCGLTGFDEGSAALVLAAAEALLETGDTVTRHSPWQHADLVGAPHLRPYQYEAYTIFRGYGYAGQVIEAPTGSGKTMIGMLCIQDWLRSLTQGQSVLVLVPTVNYQQQWVGELCYKPLGLRLSPHAVFTGTPAQLESIRQRTGVTPCVIVMTYTSLAQTGTGVGKGGFDRDSVEIFLQGSNIQYAILDEVHKVVEDVHSVSADVTRVLTDWQRDGSLRGVIGFSGTAAAYRARFAQLGLQLVYILPAAELIAYGFVAPFAEFGAPFACSDREQRIRDLLDRYKAGLREFIGLVGSANWRRWFAAIPMQERIALARSIGMAPGTQRDRDEMLAKRLQKWEQGGELSLSELSLVTLVQVAHGWSDEDAVRVASRASVAADARVGEGDERLQRFFALRQELEALRADLKPLIYLPDTVRRLEAEGFGTAFAKEAMRHLSSESMSRAARVEWAKDALASTIAGLYDTLADWYLRVGEGRVDTIKAIIEAESASRKVHGVIIFDAGTRIRWWSGVAVPGYGGVAGVFAQVLGDARFRPLAVLSNEMYMAYDETDPLPVRIAEYVRRVIMRGELGEALFGLTTQGLGLGEDELGLLRASFDSILEQYVNGLGSVTAPRPGEFSRKVLGPFRRTVRRAKLGSAGEKLLARLSLKHYHVRNCVNTFFDYALVAEAFLSARVAELAQVSGARQKFFVVKMAQGERKQLMYDLTARIVDDESLAVNTVIVSTWARTGWNVHRPNVLIDATATRDVTAWQQLRGRAMRARSTWTNECYRLLLLLVGSRAPHQESSGEVGDLGEEEPDRRLPPLILDAGARALLGRAHRLAVAPGADGRIGGSLNGKGDALDEKIERGTLAAFTLQERVQLATELMLALNKVTHIYELVKAYGASPQIRYDRPTHAWQRTEAIAVKHAREYAVSGLSGQFGPGAAHAPLVYAGDPRRDVPSELAAHLGTALGGSDPRIVEGWLRVIIEGAGGEVAE